MRGGSPFATWLEAIWAELSLFVGVVPLACASAMEVLRRSSVFAAEIMDAFDRSPTDKELVAQAKALGREYVHARLLRAGLSWSAPERASPAPGGRLAEVCTVLLRLGECGATSRYHPRPPLYSWLVGLPSVFRGSWYSCSALTFPSLERNNQPLCGCASPSLWHKEEACVGAQICLEWRGCKDRPPRLVLFCSSPGLPACWLLCQPTPSLVPA